MITDYYDNLINVGDHVKVIKENLSNFNKEFIVEDISHFSSGRGPTVGTIVCSDGQQFIRFSEKSLKVIDSNWNNSFEMKDSELKIGIFFFETYDAQSFKDNGVMKNSDHLNVPVVGYSAKNCVERFNQLNIEEKEEYEALYFDGEIYELRLAVSLNLVNQNN